MIDLYRNESANPKWDAQRNLSGRTHYVDDNTLRFHKSRVLQTAVTDGGLLFAIVESYAADYEGTTRLFRPVIFDVFGTVLERPSLENGYKTSNQASKAMRAALNGINAKQVTADAIKSQIKYLQGDLEQLTEVAA